MAWGVRIACAALAAGTAIGPAGAAGEGTALLDRARDLSKTEWSWNDRSQVLDLRIVDERGNERHRKLQMMTRREGPGEQKTLAVFLEPAEVRGTAVLQHVPKDGASSQWLYLPELGRTRRINTAARRQSFMGTDFSYADLDIMENALRWSASEAGARPLPGGSEEGRAWFELAPLDPEAAYDRVRVQLSEANAHLRAMEMGGEPGAPTKSLQFDDVREVTGIPTAFRLAMSQPDRGTRTLVDVSEVRYDTGISAETFTQRALERGLDHVR